MNCTLTVENPARFPGGEGCPSCLNELEARLSELLGVRSVSSVRGRLLVDYDPQVTNPGRLQQEARSLAESLTQTVEHHLLRVSGMDCPDCAQTVERALLKLPGIRLARVSFAGGSLQVEISSEQTDLESVVGCVQSLGYRINEDTDPSQESLFDLRLPEVRWAALGSLLWLVGMGLSRTWPAASIGAYLASMLAAGITPIARAVGALRSGQLDMNCLMVLAVVGASLIGEWAEAATVMVLFSVGEMLEGFAARRSRRALGELVKQRPELVRVQAEGGVTEVPAASLTVGQRFEARPGDRIGLDAVVVEGRSEVDSSALTGESVPVEVGPGQEVLAGSLNGSGHLVLETLRPFADSTLSRVIAMVETAQSRKASRQRLIDQFAAYYTPAVVVLALLVALGVPALTAQPSQVWVYRALVLLVIACPCALVISTPVSLVSAITGAARQGILIKGGAYLERLSRVRCVALDKTGTLTAGRMAVERVLGHQETSPTQVLTLASAVEQYSEHPLAQSVIRYAQEQNLAVPQARDFQAFPGVGAQATVGEETIVVSRPTQPPADVAGDQTVIEVLRDGQILGWLAFSDSARPTSAEAVSDLLALGLKPVMLTGDRRQVAETMGRRLGLTEVFSELLPADKLTRLESLREQHGQVAMVGDGVNDAPALAGADVGISMGAAATAVALETADVALLSADLRGVARAIRLARRSERVITQNIVFSIGVKLVFLGLAITGLANMWMAILADTGAALLVTFNGLRLVSMPAAPAPPPKPVSTCRDGCCGH